MSDARSRLTHADDSYYREHFAASAMPLADHRYEDVRPAYMLGHLAGHDPDFAALEFEEIEAELERRWNDEQRVRLGEWPAVRGFARAGWARGRSFPTRLGDLPRSRERGQAAERADRWDGGERAEPR